MHPGGARRLGRGRWSHFASTTLTIAVASAVAVVVSVSPGTGPSPVAQGAEPAIVIPKPATATAIATRAHAGSRAGTAPLAARGTDNSPNMLIRSGFDTSYPSPDGVGAFRIVCYYSHMNYDDAIIFPGQVNATHMHTYFGNTGVTANSTAANLRTTGNSSCTGGIANRSAYWAPSLMNAGQPIVPIRSYQYYKSGYRLVPPNAIQNMPAGLRMVAGTSSASGPQDSEIINWECSGSGGSVNLSIPTNCRAGEVLTLTVNFPQCWNGRDLDSADHKSHMAYPGAYERYGEGCPSSHPVPVPVLTMHVEYTVPAGGSRGLRLSSDSYATTAPGGYSAHGDFIEAWDPAIRNTWYLLCVRAGRDCGVRLVGDGRYLNDPLPGYNAPNDTTVQYPQAPSLPVPQPQVQHTGVGPGAAAAPSLFCQLGTAGPQ
jgi:hypothetical protein